MNREGGGQGLVFIGGAPRSGTTLVQNILDSHPCIWGGPEFLHIQDIIYLRRKLLDSISRKWIDIYCQKEDVDRSLSALIEKYLCTTAMAQGYKIVSEKSPQNILVFLELMELFPKSHFIHVVRDPRAVVASLMQVGRRARKKDIRTAGYTRSIESAIEYTNRCLSAGFEASKMRPDKVLTVKYEKLVMDPIIETKKICSFINVSWREEMTMPNAKRHPGEAAITENSGGIWYDKDSYNRDIDGSSIERWRGSLSRAQQAKVINAFRGGEGLKMLGYDLNLDSVAVADRAKTYATDCVGQVLGAIKILGRNVFKRVSHKNSG